MCLRRRGRWSVSVTSIGSPKSMSTTTESLRIVTVFATAPKPGASTRTIAASPCFASGRGTE